MKSYQFLKERTFIYNLLKQFAGEQAHEKILLASSGALRLFYALKCLKSFALFFSNLEKYSRKIKKPTSLTNYLMSSNSVWLTETAQEKYLPLFASILKEIISFHLLP